MLNARSVAMEPLSGGSFKPEAEMSPQPNFSGVKSVDIPGDSIARKYPKPTTVSAPN